MVVPFLLVPTLRVGMHTDNPSAGDLIQGTGGIRKIRWARGNKGKSGGVRVIYYYHSEIMPLYLLAMFGENEKSNISMEEKYLLSSMVKKLVSHWRAKFFGCR